MVGKKSSNGVRPRALNIKPITILKQTQYINFNIIHEINLDILHDNNQNNDSIYINTKKRNEHTRSWRGAKRVKNARVCVHQRHIKMHKYNSQIR